MDYERLIPILYSLVTTVGLVLALLDNRKNKNNAIDRQTAQILNDNIAAKDKEIAQMRSDHDKEIANLNARLATAEVNAQNLQTQLDALQKLVTGHEQLTKILQILAPVPKLFEKGGFIDTVITNQQEMLKNTSETLQLLDDEKPNPPKRPFTTRAQSVQT